MNVFSKDSLELMYDPQKKSNVFFKKKEARKFTETWIKKVRVGLKMLICQLG